MDVYCTRPHCLQPVNRFLDLDNRRTVKTIDQKHCECCGMPLILGGRYIPQTPIERGGFGATYRAIDRYTPTLRPCVVKQFQPAGTLSNSQLHKAQILFEREAHALENLGNPHPQIPDLFAYFELEVPPLYEGAPDDRFFYLVQEFIDGVTMGEELERRGALPEAEVREIAIEILRILQFVHDRDNIHRDIKPSNIMRRFDGLLYLLDFGAVKQVSQGSDTRFSTGIYSMGFAPPEQMNGGQVYPATDLFALAVTALTLLTDRDPSDLFDSYNSKWRWGEIPVSGDFKATLQKMLQPVPSDRFTSAAAALAALGGRSALPSPSPLSPALPIASFQRPPANFPATSPQADQLTQLPPDFDSPFTDFPDRQLAPPYTSPFSDRQRSRLLMLLRAGFFGFEVALLGTIVSGVLGVSQTSIVVWGMIIGLFLLAIVTRAIDGWDFPLVAGATLAFAIAMRVFGLGLNLPLLKVLAIAILGWASAIALACFYRLVRKVWRLRSRWRSR
jgi:serine/threonine protein kinase